MKMERDIMTIPKKKYEMPMPGWMKYEDGILEIKIYDQCMPKEHHRIRFAQTMAAMHKHPMPLLNLLVKRYGLEVSEIEMMFDDIPMLKDFYDGLHTEYDDKMKEKYRQMGRAYENTLYDYRLIAKARDAFRKEYGISDRQASTLNGRLRKANHVWTHEGNLIAYYLRDIRKGTYEFSLTMPCRKDIMEGLDPEEIGNPKIMPYDHIESRVVPGGAFKSLLSRKSLIRYCWKGSDEPTLIYVPAMRKALEFLDMKRDITMRIATREKILQLVQDDRTIQVVAGRFTEDEDVMSEVIEFRDLGK